MNNIQISGQILNLFKEEDNIYISCDMKIDDYTTIRFLKELSQKEELPKVNKQYLLSGHFENQYILADQLILL